MAKNYRQEIFLESLPKWGEKGCGKDGTINWVESIGFKVNGIYDDINFEIEIINYNSKTKILKIRYNDKEFNIKTDSFKKCKLGKMMGKITSDFKYEIGTEFKDNKRDIIITDREYRKEENIDNQGRKSIANRKWYKYTCNVCGWTEGWIIEGSLKTSGCRCCANQIPVLGINTIWDTDKWMIPYIGEEIAKTHTHRSDKEVLYTYIEDGKIISKNIMKISYIYSKHLFNNYYSYKDGISMPNKTMFNMLEQLNVEFMTEYSPSWIGLKRYDFFIPLLNIIIEMDGAWHTKDNNKSGQSAEKSKETDDYKDEQARLHGIEMIRIDCDYNSMDTRFKYIQNNLLNNKKLNKLFDLNKIDWNKCHEYGLSNLVKVACDYKNNNKELTTTEIGKLMKTSQPTVISWLKDGSEVGWCNYYPTKQIEIFKDRISLGVFESARKLEENSVEKFGVKLNKKSIFGACASENSEYKGYTFSYITR